VQFEKILGPSGYLENRNNALGGRTLIAFSTLGGAHPESPISFRLNNTQQDDIAILMGGDLRTIEAVRDFWQLAIDTMNTFPKAIWLNLTAVNEADTKLAACIVALLRRAIEVDINIYIVGSEAVQDILQLCKVPPLKYFTKVA
jgi:hypothetical protein